jgi:hypothetical protein
MNAQVLRLVALLCRIQWHFMADQIHFMTYQCNFMVEPSSTRARAYGLDH